MPVPYTALRPLTKETRRTQDTWEPLRTAGLIETTPYDMERRRCREYRAAPHLVRAFACAVPQDTSAPDVDLVTGKATERKERLYRTQSDETPVPRAIYDALHEIRRNGCLLDYEAVAELVAGRRAKAIEAQALVDKNRDDEDARRAAVSAWGQYYSDAHCLHGVRSSGLRRAQGVWRYTPTFLRDPQSAGRVTEAGGLQACSRRMKHVALAPLRESHDVRNYDLSAAHPRILVQLLEDREVEAGWLRDYIEADKEAYAKKAFGADDAGTVGLWKQCALAVFNGASLPRALPTDAPGKWRSKIAEYVFQAYAHLGSEYAQGKLDSFREVIAPYVPLRDALYAALDDEVNRGVLRVGGRGGNWVRNACGCTLNTAGLSDWERHAKLVAHLMQGYEAALIHTLTTLGPEHGFRVMSNQHDGVVTIGEVPTEAVEAAMEVAGVRDAVLKEKRYHPDLPIPGGP